MPDEMWRWFATAGFTCWCPDPVTVRPAPAGARSGRFPFPHPVTFVTADNPGGQAVPHGDNLRRRAVLAAALNELGASWVPAVGGDPELDHLEPGAVILGLDLTSATALGAKFDQAAVYIWAADALHLVACARDRHEVLGYRASPGPPSLLRPDLRDGPPA